MDIAELVDHDHPDSTDRPFRCNWTGCSKAFTRRSDLARHSRIHTNDRPFACNEPGCGKSFIQRSALTVHMRTHTGERPHVCEFEGCNKSFSDSSSLARHRRVHVGKRSYRCTFESCNKCFWRKSTLIKHYRLHMQSLGQSGGSESASAVSPSAPDPGPLSASQQQQHHPFDPSRRNYTGPGIYTTLTSPSTPSVESFSSTLSPLPTVAHGSSDQPPYTRILTTSDPRPPPPSHGLTDPAMFPSRPPAYQQRHLNPPQSPLAMSMSMPGPSGPRPSPLMMPLYPPGGAYMVGSSPSSHPPGPGEMVRLSDLTNPLTPSSANIAGYPTQPYTMSPGSPGPYAWSTPAYLGPLAGGGYHPATGAPPPVPYVAHRRPMSTVPVDRQLSRPGHPYLPFIPPPIYPAPYGYRPSSPWSPRALVSPPSTSASATTPDSLLGRGGPASALIRTPHDAQLPPLAGLIVPGSGPSSAPAERFYPARSPLPHSASPDTTAPATTPVLPLHHSVPSPPAMLDSFPTSSSLIVAADPVLPSLSAMTIQGTPGLRSPLTPIQSTGLGPPGSSPGGGAASAYSPLSAGSSPMPQRYPSSSPSGGNSSSFVLG
ncbi:hypothetical protein H4R33_003731 [Dimargaris cristalligena]|nr:hypothetical protein H4R33_003731 [Dimargaris cristalligena]